MRILRGSRSAPNPDPDDAMEAAYDVVLDHYLAVCDVKQGLLNL